MGVSSELEDLIEAYQLQADHLKLEIEECLKFGHYLEAHYLGQAMGQTQNTLRRLEKLKNPVGNELNHLLRLKEQSEKIQNSEWVIYPPPGARIERSKVSLDEQIASLKTYLTRPLIDDQVIFEHLKELQHGKYRALRLHLKRKRSLFLELTMSESDDLLIQLDPESIPEDKSWYHSYAIDQLHHFGFRQSNGCWSRSFDLVNDPYFTKVYECLARLAFELFDVSSTKDEVVLEIIN